MWPGTPVLASRAGVVEALLSTAPDHPGLHRGNHVLVRHDDGSAAIYAHLTGGQIRVDVGDRVLQRDILGTAGLSGMTLHPHLHFQAVGPEGESRPVAFQDVHEGDGIPKLYGKYTAQKIR